METPVTVIGWETVLQKNEKPGIRIYGSREVVVGEGQTGEGREAVRIYINPEYCKYSPKIGDVIIAIEGRFGVDRIIKMN